MRVLILGAGFGGLELATCLSDALGDEVAVTLIDKSDSFVFGYSKLDVIFGKEDPKAALDPIVPGHIGLIVIRSDGSRYVAQAEPDPLAER